MDDLAFLNSCSNEELAVLVQIILEKGGPTERLSCDEKYKKCHPDHKQYVDVIIREILDFGSNTFWFQCSYREIVEDVCKKMKVSYRSTDSIETMESQLLATISYNMWDKLSEEDKRAVLQSVDKDFNMAELIKSKAGILQMFFFISAGVISVVADIAGPAYRVTVPAVTYIAALRMIHDKKGREIYES